MKSPISILIILICVLSCCNSKPKKELSKKEKQEKRVKENLSEYSEKIVLLSVIKKIPYDSLKFILTEYYTITAGYTNSSDSLKYYSEKAISHISEKYHILKRRAASLIFSFKYEMLTKEEIVDEEINRRDDEQEDPPENT